MCINSRISSTCVLPWSAICVAFLFVFMREWIRAQAHTSSKLQWHFTAVDEVVSCSRGSWSHSRFACTSDWDTANYSEQTRTVCVMWETHTEMTAWVFVSAEFYWTLLDVCTTLNNHIHTHTHSNSLFLIFENSSIYQIEVIFPCQSIIILY